MRILVTGGAGFIGSNFIRYIHDIYKQDTIVNFDLLTYAGNAHSLRYVQNSSRYKFVKGNIASPEDVDAVFSMGIDVVVNFAAESHVDRSILNPQAFTVTNVLGTQILLDAARAFGVQKFVQVSTDEVYGTLGEEGVFTEETPIQPNSPYSASKASADQFVRAYYETYDLPVNITRCSNNYGPNQHPEKLVPLMITHAIEGRPLPVYGDGQQIRDWLHVWDHCAGIDSVLRHGIPGRVYNIGGNNERTNLDVVRMILRELSKPDSLVIHVPDRPGHDRRYAIDASRIRQELGWSPKYNFESGIVETISWYMHNEWWWSPMRERLI